MKKIYGYIKMHLREDFDWRLYSAITLFIGLCIFFNYFYFGLFQNKWITIERYLTTTFYAQHSPLTIPVFFLFYAFPYFAAVGIHCLIKRDYSYVRQGRFWLKSIFAILLISTATTTHLYHYIASAFTHPPDHYWVMKIVSPLMPYLYQGLPLLLFWWLYDRRREGMTHFYGLTFRGFQWHPYALILLLIFPFVFWAACQPAFLNYYPTLRLQRIEGLTLLPQWAAIGTYEVIYGGYFVWVEVVLRGFLVVGMANIMGRNAILPMVAMYAACHFAKPLGETISSVFGGYLLGIIALHSRNIMGGFWVHAGIAMMMDCLALFVSRF